MKHLSLLLGLLLFNSVALALSGTWQFTEIIYQNQRQPLISPDLRLQWTFFENGTEKLYWDRNNTIGFCERMAYYKIDKGFLEEEVFATHPQNSHECANDPDMQIGRVSRNKIDIFKNEIWLHFNLGDEELIYVLTPYFPKKL